MALNGRISTFGTSSKKINYQNKISGKGQDLMLKSTISGNNGLGTAPEAAIGYDVSPTPSVSTTPSVSVTPSITPSVSVTPSISYTPSVSVTPSITPSVSVTPSPST